MATTYLLTAKIPGAVNTRGHSDAMIITADNETTAREMAAAHFNSDFPWEDSDATNAVVFPVSAAADYEGWRVEVIVRPSGGGFNEYNVSATGAASDTFGDILTAVKDALVAAGLLAGLSVLDLRVADNADNLGDHIVSAHVFAPSGEVPIDSFVSSITAQGASGDELHVAFAEPTAIPTILQTFRQVL